MADVQSEIRRDQSQIRRDQSAPTLGSRRYRARVDAGALLPGLDGRGSWPRKLAETVRELVAELGGPELVTAQELMIVRRAAVLGIELARMEESFAKAGRATSDELQLYATVASQLRRLLESIGLARRARDITPSLRDYMAGR